MAPFVAACEADDPAYFVSPGERERWLAADVDALRAARLTNLTEPNLERDAVAAIRAPTLIYAGTDDNPEPKEEAARLLPNASDAPIVRPAMLPTGVNHLMARFGAWVLKEVLGPPVALRGPHDDGFGV